ncbi:hypothetical protein EAI_03623 [Harpegnathos saltator]|uniref:Uncharacterized protein n=1 Tax=Harpegnathos saltator TaxID=610380 RepID=E2B8B0_HARSA|nr:hypothetical protein EAI_03623 [Harpegnathos saltator]
MLGGSTSLQDRGRLPGLPLRWREVDLEIMDLLHFSPDTLPDWNRVLNGKDQLTQIAAPRLRRRLGDVHGRDKKEEERQKEQDEEAAEEDAEKKHTSEEYRVLVRGKRGIAAVRHARVNSKQESGYCSSRVDRRLKRLDSAKTPWLANRARGSGRELDELESRASNDDVLQRRTWAPSINLPVSIRNQEPIAATSLPGFNSNRYGPIIARPGWEPARSIEINRLVESREKTGKDRHMSIAPVLVAVANGTPCIHSRAFSGIYFIHGGQDCSQRSISLALPIGIAVERYRYISFGISQEA